MHASSIYRTPALTWLALTALTLLSVELGAWLPAADWLPLLVALIVWCKGMLVARGFLEGHRAHPFVRHLLAGFIAFAPAALVFTAFFGERLAR